MAQRIPADCRLGRSKAGLPIGYRILALNEELITPFTRENVKPATLPGSYFVSGGTIAPDAGGRIIWGTEAQDLADAPIEPAALGTLIARQRPMLDALVEQFVAAVPAPVLQTDMSSLENMISDFLTALAQTLGETDRLQDDRIASVVGVVNVLAEQLASLRALNQAASGVAALDSIRIKLNELFGAQSPVVQMIGQAGQSEQITETLDAYRSDIDRLTATITEQQTHNASIGRSIQALDKFLAFTIGGQKNE